jgi:hypothetical protein
MAPNKQTKQTLIFSLPGSDAASFCTEQISSLPRRKLKPHLILKLVVFFSVTLHNAALIGRLSSFTIGSKSSRDPLRLSS